MNGAIEQRVGDVTKNAGLEADSRAGQSSGTVPEHIRQDWKGHRVPGKSASKSNMREVEHYDAIGIGTNG
jgi:hypothetical protein